MSANPVPISARGAPSPLTMWRHVIAGLSASLIGIGLARFAYTPLIPALIQAHWFSASDVVYLGAANLAGYFTGAVVGRPIAARITNVDTLRSMMILATLSFLACAFPLSVSWFFVWRFLSGVAGGAIMVLVAATVLPHMPSHRRGLASGAVFLGLGLGIAASGSIVSLLLQFGLRTTWIGLAILSALLTAASWTGWPRKGPPAQAEACASAQEYRQPSAVMSVALVYGVYALVAVGLVPPMVFLVDFIARGLHAGERLGSFFWILYGLGAILGPPVYGYFTDYLGAPKALPVFLAIQVGALVGLATAQNFIVIGILAIMIGTFPPGIVPMVLGWLREIYPGDTARQNILWGRATIVFAAFQALAGYAYSAIFAYSDGDHRLLFEIGAAAIAIALVIELVVPPLAQRRRAATV